MALLGKGFWLLFCSFDYAVATALIAAEIVGFWHHSAESLASRSTLLPGAAGKLSVEF